MKCLAIKWIAPIALLSLLMACGGGDSKGSKSTAQLQEVQPQDALPLDGSNIEGIYMAQFETLNGHINGTIPGSATFQRKDEKLYAYVRIFAGGPQVWHKQAVYSGNRCPTMADDLNGDGFLDIVEAEQVLGQIMIPLDADIGSQAAGRNFYPVADLSGSYFYERITSFRRFYEDLRGEDREPNDNVRKLAPDEGLEIIGRPVIVQGVAQSMVFPETVAGSGRYRPFQTLPIVCGIYQRVDTVPGEVDTGEIPGPVAEVEEGQDRPAPDGGVITRGDGPSTGGSTGSNTSTPGETPTEEGPRDEIPVPRPRPNPSPTPTPSPSPTPNPEPTPGPETPPTPETPNPPETPGES